MKRRLTKAYDRMTMPDHCADSIERKLEEQLQQQKKGNYTRILSAAPGQRNGWAVGVAVVCLMLALSAGGTMLFLRASDAIMDNPAETVYGVAEQENAVTATPEDHYTVATNFSVEKVESFAKIVRSNVLQENWEALRDKVQLPVTIQGQKVSDWDSFVEWMEIFALNPLLTDRMERESCTAMFCNWQGISMARGLVWFKEMNGELKITAVNEEIQSEPETPNSEKQVPEAFEAVLSGQAVDFYGNQGEVTLEEYCDAKWGSVIVDKFAVVDMDADGICEVVASVQTADMETRAHLVLRQDGDKICGYPFQPGEMLDLKKDGSFFRRDREYRLFFNDRSSWMTLEVLGLQQEIPLAQWHTYPCQRPELLLRSYENVTGIGWSIFPGHPYYLLEGLAMERAGNAIEILEYWKNSGIWCQEGNAVYIFDPDAPGTAFYGTLTEEQGFAQFSQVGYYISEEDREYQAEIRNMLSDEPEYWADVHLPFLGTKGRMVSTPEELAAYFGYTPMPDEETMQQTRELKALVDNITEAYLAGGSEAMKPYLAQTYQNQEKNFFPKNAVIKLMTYSALPERVMEVGETLHVSAGIRLEGDDRDYSFNLELVKQKDGWKIQSYYLWIDGE